MKVIVSGSTHLCSSSMFYWQIKHPNNFNYCAWLWHNHRECSAEGWDYLHSCRLLLLLLQLFLLFLLKELFFCTSEIFWEFSLVFICHPVDWFLFYSLCLNCIRCFGCFWSFLKILNSIALSSFQLRSLTQPSHRNPLPHLCCTSPTPPPLYPSLHLHNQVKHPSLSHFTPHLLHWLSFPF